MAEPGTSTPETHRPAWLRETMDAASRVVADEQVPTDTIRADLVGAPASAVPVPSPEDLQFIADLARRMYRDALQGDDPDAAPETLRCRADVAIGTLDALLWVLGVTTIAPVSGREIPTPIPADLLAESDLADALRVADPFGPRSGDYHGGVADALWFALGVRCRYWWVPLPEPLRRLRPGQDEAGRTSN